MYLELVNEGQAATDATPTGGYAVTLTRARFALSDLEFTAAGLDHASSSSRRGSFYDWLVPSAFAHPGHTTGGAVIGVLPGRFVFDPFRRRTWGTAELLAGNYDACNFRWVVATAGDVGPNDPLMGHSAYLEGSAEIDERVLPFVAWVDAADSDVVGVPFSARIAASSTGQLFFRFAPLDPFEGDSLFAGVPFDRLAPSADGIIELAPHAPAGPNREAYDLLKSRLMTPDHFLLEIEE